MFEHLFRYVFGEQHPTYRNPLYAIVQPERGCSIEKFSGGVVESGQPFENTAAVERATSPTKFANALNYGRSLALILDK
ncbi:MAG: hypothetical protein M3Q99_09590 [Acidobacteriota bacterium]|nr:hypothetical protein [Acidobacteriota bacterium]